MNKVKELEFYPEDELEYRVRALVRMARIRVPPLKAIPKKDGEFRKLRPAKSRK